VNFLKALVPMAAAAIGIGAYWAYAGMGGPPTQTRGSAGAMPKTMEQLKEKEVLEAMRGLDYSSGRVRLAADSGKIAGPGTPEEVRAQVAKAQATADKNSWTQSIREFTKAVIMDPENPRALYGLAKALITEGEVRRAEAALRTALDYDPRYVDAQIELGWTLQRLDRFEDAMRAFERAARLDRTNGDVHARIAILAYYLHQNDKALEHLKIADRLGGNVPPQFRDHLRDQINGGGA